MKKKKLTFKLAYLIYLVVLIILVAGATLYVSRLLRQYENTLPEKYVEDAMNELAKKAADKTLWQQYILPDTETGKYEEDMNVAEEYMLRFAQGEKEYVQKDGDYPEDELYYTITSDGAPLAEVKLKAKGETVTKLAILSYREWNTEYIKPILEKNDYTLVVPNDFSVKVNQIALSEQDGKENGKGETEYTIEGVYFAPEFEIKDAAGENVSYKINDEKVVAEYYYYSFVLPDTLSVKVNGEVLQGVEQENHSVYYDIKELVKPEVIISDLYGNEISYEGGKKLPLTHKMISADSGYEVSVLDESVPKEAVFVCDNSEYEALKDYVDALPQMNLYNIAVLKEDVPVCVTTPEGEEILLEDGQTDYSFMAKDKSLESVPDEVSAQVDVLSLAQKWSLFMSADVPFNEMSQYLVKGSYQYEVAKKYANGVDIKFISGHGLANPPFTEESVTNFIWIADNCFSVDVSFVKHMILRVGTRVDDPMNDRFYFVKYDDTEDGVDNPMWKIVSMKEIVEDGE